MEFVAVGHGILNLSIAFLFWYQGWLGLRIRAYRLKRAPRNAVHVRRHRKLGPVLVILAAIGYLWGGAMVYIPSGHVFHVPVHHGMGLGIVVLALAVYLTSTRIKGTASRIRLSHLTIGVVLLIAYVLQVYLGLSIFFGHD